VKSEIWTYLIWGFWFALFLALEIPALFHAVPWTPLSDMAWHLEGISVYFKWLFFLGLAVLLMHIVAKFPA
jgi:hypothetical protein